MKKSISFTIKQMREDDNTFSAGGLFTFMESMLGWHRRAVAIAIMDGFEKKEPVKKIEFNVEMKINGERITTEQLDKLFGKYPPHVAITEEFIFRMLKEKLGGNNGGK